MFTQRAFDLLRLLSDNNNRDWYSQHRDEIKDLVLVPFGAMLESVSATLAGSELPISGSQRTMFRMSRDVRFSKDKRPYRETVAGLLTTSGTKQENDGVVYTEFSVSGGWVGGGFYQLPTKELNVIRDHMVENPDAWIAAKAMVRERGGGIVMTETLKRMPRGYEEHEKNPIAVDLKLKNLLVRNELDPSAWLNGTIVDRVAHAALACAPVIAFGLAAKTAS